MHDDDDLADLDALAQQALKTGDVVELLTGGPQMVVQQVTLGTALCSWFKDRTLLMVELPCACLLRIRSH